MQTPTVTEQNTISTTQIQTDKYSIALFLMAEDIQ